MAKKKTGRKELLIQIMSDFLRTGLSTSTPQMLTIPVTSKLSRGNIVLGFEDGHLYFEHDNPESTTNLVQDLIEDCHTLLKKNKRLARKYAEIREELERETETADNLHRDLREACAEIDRLKKELKKVNKPKVVKV